MRRKNTQIGAHALAVFLSLAFLLAACAPSGQPAQVTSTAEPEADIEEAAISEAVCTAVSSAEREDFLADLPFEPINDADWRRGPSDAPVSILEYSDFQCPHCGALYPVLSELKARYADDLLVAYRHFPLIGTEEQPIHPKAALSAQASEAAGRQDMFWEMHDLLFERQAEWTELSDAEFEGFLMDAAAELGLDAEQFSADLHSEALSALAADAWQEGQDLGITGTPFLLINGIPYQGPRDLNSLDTIIQLELLRERQFNACPDFIIDTSQDYAATLHTAQGDIVVQLYPEVAPMAVNSFVFLAENDWFDNVTFHRVLPGFVAQAGDPTGTGYGGPGYAFGIEVSPNLTFDRAGLLAMANSGPSSNGSQFFITLGPADHLDGSYTIFGEVLDGMDVVQSLSPRDPSQSADLPPGDLILDVSIEVR